MRHTLLFLRSGLMKIGAVMVLFLVTAQSANAQANPSFYGLPATTNIMAPSPLPGVGPWITNGTSTYGTAAGVDVAVSGSRVVNGIKVPISIVTSASRVGIAAGVAGCFSGVLSVVGCAATVAIVGDALKKAGVGYGKCPDGSYAWICKASSSVVDPKLVWYFPNAVNTTYGSASAACSAKTGGGYAGPENYCYLPSGQYAAVGAPSARLVCDAGTLGPGNKCLNADGTQATSSAPPHEATGSEIGADIGTQMGADPTLAPKIWGAGQDDQGRSPRPESKMIDDTAPVVVTAPAVAGEAVVKSVETSTKPDGSIDTKTTTETPTITPKTAGATNGSSVTTFPTTTTTKTTVTNNVSGATTTTTNITNNAAPAASAADAPKIDLPTDYNRETTQQAILKSLDGTGIPDASTVDKDSDLAKIDQKNAEIKNGLDQITEGSIGLFDWFPRIQTAQCQDPQVQNPVTHSMVSMEWPCKTVNIFTTFISAVMCFFCLIGSVRNVQDALKA